ncbi:MAG: TIGR03915 family putative DNA repair protein [Schaedlerella sp.]|nr:TIGR03915 family putative DNA repair protein [Schaedlerella sp.]
MVKTVFVCEDSMTAMLSAIYDAWKGFRNKDAGIELKGRLEHQLFCDYVEVQADEKKAAAVVRMIRKNLGQQAYFHIYHALLSENAKKADAVFHVLQEARKIPNSKKIMDHLTDFYVKTLFTLSRNVRNEVHFHIELLRFRELENGILFAEILPKNRILTCIGDHFANRFPLENWIICDKTHREFLVHKTRYDWVLVTGEKINWEAADRVSEQEKEYARLWKGFFQAISIEERKNPVCQRNHLPFRYRGDMTEFEEDNSHLNRW